jgi:DNA polymerase-3 subunit delta'
MQNKMTSLLLHPQTRLQVQYYLKDPSQVLFISAPNGSGKKTIARTIAAELLELPPEKNVENYHYFFYVRRLKNKNDISIEQVRTVIDALKLRTPGTTTIKRVVMIENAHFLSFPAQNALLKILEEPNSDTVFLLTANSIQNVLPTIISRAQKLELLPASLSETSKYWQNNFADKDIESAWRLSGGGAGLMHALLSENNEHSLKKSVDEAKKFLTANKYQRLLSIDHISRNREQLQNFLEALSKTLIFLHHSAVRKEKRIQSANLLNSRKLISKSLKALDANANSKLVALKLVMGLNI